MTLVELLIAMTLMAIGIAAIVAGFTSGLFAVNRADKAAVAATLAERQMETFKQESYSAIPVTTTTTTLTGSDGRSYWMQTTITMQCPDGSTPSPSCPLGEPVKAVTIVVRDGSSTEKMLITENSTFDSLSG
jgi:type II secretory pathway pseudopilin PulG